MKQQLVDENSENLRHDRFVCVLMMTRNDIYDKKLIRRKKFSKRKQQITAAVAAGWLTSRVGMETRD